MNFFKNSQSNLFYYDFLLKPQYLIHINLYHLPSPILTRHFLLFKRLLNYPTLTSPKHFQNFRKDFTRSHNLSFFFLDNSIFATMGEGNLKFWTMDISIGNTKRCQLNYKALGHSLSSMHHLPLRTKLCSLSSIRLLSSFQSFVWLSSNSLSK